jgi:uncharacterized protein (TIGR03663 family)
VTVERERRVRVGLLAVAALALLARFAFLGARTAHWDEARVGLVTLSYLETGVWSYDPLVHGPLLFHVNRLVFDVFGPGTVAARFAPAAVGGMLPLAAWLFRDRLAGDEVLALGVVLAANPLLLYYSRFARNDVPLAAAMLVAFGLLVRARETGRGRYLVAASVAVAVGVGLKENAVLYLVCWAAAGPLVAAVRWRGVGADVADESVRALRRLGGWTRRRWPSVLAGVLAASTLVVALYAPRDPAGLRLWSVLANPAGAPAFVSAATVRPMSRLVGFWLVEEGQEVGPRTLFYAAHLVAVVGAGAGATTLLGVAGTLSAARDDAFRPLVLVAAAWAGLSLLGYPLAADLAAPWLAVHVVVPLSIPAAVGLAAVVRRHRAAVAGRRRAVGPDRVFTAAALVLLVLSTQVVAIGAVTSYAVPDHRLNVFGQPAQPGPDAERAAAAVDRAVCPGDAVLFYGDYFDPRYDWRRLPLSWHAAVAGAESRFAATGEFPATPPPVVVALSGRHAELDRRLAGYDRHAVELDPWVDREPDASLTSAVVYVDAGDSGCAQSPASAA